MIIQNTSRQSIYQSDEKLFNTAVFNWWYIHTHTHAYACSV